MHTQEPEVTDQLHTVPIYVNRMQIRFFLSQVLDQLFGLGSVRDQVVLSTLHQQFLDLIPVSHLISSRDEPHHSCIIRKIDDGIVRVVGGAVMGVQSVEERAQYTPLGGASVESKG